MERYIAADAGTTRYGDGYSIVVRPYPERRRALLGESIDLEKPTSIPTLVLRLPRHECDDATPEVDIKSSRSKTIFRSFPSVASWKVEPQELIVPPDTDMALDEEDMQWLSLLITGW
jgi:hypothetical protein